MTKTNLTLLVILTDYFVTKCGYGDRLVFLHSDGLVGESLVVICSGVLCLGLFFFFF